MNRVTETVRSAALLVWLLVRAGATSVRSSWGLACFSLVAAFAVWAVVQDVENPREEGVFPVDGGVGISVVAMNIPEGYVLRSTPSVAVRVEARKEDLPTLRAADFRATVDMQGAPTDGEPTTRTVTVESRKDGVEVLDIEPLQVEVALVAATEKLVKVEYREIGSLPEGYRKTGETIDPEFVTVYGLKELVDLVETVEIGVNLSGVRVETYEAEGELVARDSTGNALSVRMLNDDRIVSRGSVTFNIEPVVQSRTMALAAQVAGSVAPGYRITDIIVEPRAVLVTGSSAVLDSLTSGLLLEPIDVTNATADIDRPRGILAPNVTPEVDSVRVRVVIVPVVCGESEDSDTNPPCGPQTITAAPSFDTPAGIAVQGDYTVTVRVGGSLAAIAALKPGDIGATVDLTGATPGTTSYLPVATAPPGITVLGVDPIIVTTTAVAP